MGPEVRKIATTTSIVYESMFAVDAGTFVRRALASWLKVLMLLSWRFIEHLGRAT